MILLIVLGGAAVAFLLVALVVHEVEMARAARRDERRRGVRPPWGKGW